MQNSAPGVVIMELDDDDDEENKEENSALKNAYNRMMLVCITNIYKQILIILTKNCNIYVL